MTETVTSPLSPSEDEHTIAALLSQPSVATVEDLQDKLKQILGDAIWLTPANCLHMTLMEIIRDTEYQGLSRAEYFKRWYGQYNERVHRIIAGFAPIEARFNELHISPSAIIIKAANPEPFNEIRAKLLVETKLPEGTKLPPDIAHCTIARFDKVLDLEGVRSRAGGLLVNFTEYVTEFSLIKDLAPPDFDRKVLETYRLSQ